MLTLVPPPDDEPKPPTPETEASMRQRMAYDIAPDDMLTNATKGLGLTPASEDVVALEMLASNMRRRASAPLVPLLLILSRLSSEVINGAILVRQQESGSPTAGLITPEQVFTATRAIIANLIDMGLVHLPHPEIGVVE